MEAFRCFQAKAPYKPKKKMKTRKLVIHLANIYCLPILCQREPTVLSHYLKHLIQNPKDM